MAINWKRAGTTLTLGALMLAGSVLTPAHPASARACSFAGTWDTGGYGMLEIVADGKAISGTYSYSGKDGQLIGEQEENVGIALGRWAENPAPAGQGNGLFAFDIAADCNSFKGAYGYGDSTSAAGEWNAKRVK